MTSKFVGTGKVTIGFDDLSRHIYLLGSTGSGKTSLIRAIAKGLEEANKTGEFRSSFFFIDVKGDDSYKFLAQLDSLNPEKIHFLDPILTSFSVNPLELPPHASENRERVVSVFVGFLMKILEEWYQAEPTKAPRMLRILRSLIYYLYRKSDSPTLLDLFDLVLRMQEGDDPVLFADLQDTLSEGEAGILKKEMDAISGLGQEAFDPVLTRLSEFAIDPFLRKMFSVRHSTVDFAELLKPGHTTVIRVPGHEVGSHISPLIVSVIVLKIWFTIQERASLVPEAERNTVVLALDEFQSIQRLQAIQNILTQARSFDLALILSHQTSSQLDEELFRVILGNCAIQGCGRVSGDDARRIAYT
jgi:DNA helicase HerA-like ATPase